MRELRDALNGLPYGEEVADLIEESYRPGSTMGKAFSELLHRLLREFNVLQVDPMLPEFRRPSNWRQALWGGWTCPQCRHEFDRFGRCLGIAGQPLDAACGSGRRGLPAMPRSDYSPFLIFYLFFMSAMAPLTAQ